MLDQTENGVYANGVAVADFDNDGMNEIKACNIISKTGKEWIFK